MINGYDAVIFDMDGVIFDTEKLFLECCIRAALDIGAGDITEVAYSAIGMSEERTVEKYRKFFGDNEKAERFFDSAKELIRERLAQDIPVKPGAREILSYLYESGMPVALASSTKTEKVIRELIKTDLFGYFTRISGGDSVKNSKPAPDIFLRTAELLGKEPQKCLVIEDSFNGVRAAKAAGMKCIMVPDLLQPDDEIKALADMFVPSLTELKELFAEGNI